jgi:predicted transcriptional regulator of viral defense system
MVEIMDNEKTLGKVSAKLISKLYDENRPIFDIAHAQQILDYSYNNTKDLLKDLVKRKVIVRLKAGKYLIIPQEIGSGIGYVGNWYIAAKEVINSPQYYIAFYSAMNYWGMLTQPLVKIFVATPKRQVVPREMKGKMVFITIKKESIWGIKEEWIERKEKIRISDIEKTVIDCLTFPQYCGGITEIAKGIWIVKEKIDQKKLLSYVTRQDKNVVAKRLGYLLELLNIGNFDINLELKKYVKDRYDLFDPTLSFKRINKNNWRLIDNVGQNQIKDTIRF